MRIPDLAPPGLGKTGPVLVLTPAEQEHIARQDLRWAALVATAEALKDQEAARKFNPAVDRLVEDYLKETLPMTFLDILKGLLNGPDAFSVIITTTDGETENLSLCAIHDDCLEVKPLGEHTPERTFILINQIVNITVEW